MKKYWMAILFVISLISISLAQINTEAVKKFHCDMAQQKSILYSRIKQCNAQQTLNQQAYDVKYYNLDLDINPDNSTISGIVEILSEVVSSSLETMEVNLLDNMNVTAVTMDTNAVLYSQGDDLIYISLDRTYERGELFRVKIEYSGSPSQSGLGSFGFSTFQQKPMIWSLSEPFGARNWWPCKDIPADKADSVDINITVPTELIVASNGVLRDVINLGTKKKYCWHEGYPIVTYLVSVAIHPYTVYSDWYKYSETDSMEIQFYVFPSHYKLVQDNYAKTKTMIKAFAEYFGEYPFIKEKYGHAEFLWGGGMEHQTITSLGGWNEWLIAHELAHQWWGDMITCESFHHIWLNEGFATYSEALWYEYLHGIEGYHSYIAHDEYLGPGTVYVEDPEHDNIFNGNLSYSKGAWVLHMLRHVVGDSNFFKILKTYGAHPDHQYGTATTEQFQNICEKVSGMDLSAFFRQWIYESGHPVYAYTWNSQAIGSGKYSVIGAIAQTQDDASLFEMPVDVTIQTASAETTIVVWVRGECATFECTVNSAPVDVLIDKDKWILREIVEKTIPLITYTDIKVDDSEGNNDGHADPGETIDLIIQLTNVGKLGSDVWAILSTDDPMINILADSSYYGDVNMGSMVDNSSSPFVLNISAGSLGHTASFDLLITTNQGYKNYLTMVLEIGISKILLVDDDDGESYESFYYSMADKASMGYETWEIATQGVPADTVLDHEMIIWFTGDDKNSSLTTDEQHSLMNYLDTGGRLCLTGQNIGYDLVVDGSLSDSLFYADYLHALFIDDGNEEFRVLGSANDPISAGLSPTFIGEYGGAENQNSPSIIAPIDPAVTVYKYLYSQQPAAIRYENQQTGSRMVYFAFGLEGIAGPEAETASTLLGRTMTWLAGTTTATSVKEKVISTDIATDYYLEQNYPNPFNMNTQINFSIPQEGKVSLIIYNIKGQLVRTLLQSDKAPGQYIINWDGYDNLGSQVGSGIYFYHLNVKGRFSKTQKMVLMK